MMKNKPSYTEEKVGLPALKKHMVLSYEHVCRQHKKITGKTIVEHLTETRMAYAAHLLTTTDMSILEIAMEVCRNILYPAGFRFPLSQWRSERISDRRRYDDHPAVF